MMMMMMTGRYGDAFISHTLCDCDAGILSRGCIGLGAFSTGGAEGRFARTAARFSRQTRPLYATAIGDDGRSASGARRTLNSCQAHA